MTNSGRSAWFGGVLVLTVYLIFAMTLYLLPPRLSEGTRHGKTTERSSQRTHKLSKVQALDTAARPRSNA